MSKKRDRPEEIISKLVEADVLISQGKKVVEVIKALGITAVTYYRWRQEYGGMSVPQAKRLKELEKEPRILIEQWRRHYNGVRPHSALGYRPPAPETIAFPVVGHPNSLNSLETPGGFLH